MSKENYLIIGKIGKSHGIHGFVSLHSYTQPIENILDYDELYLETKTGWQIIKILDSQIHTKKLLIKIQNFANPEIASTLTNCHLAIKQDCLPTLSDNEYYLKDLAGLTVVNLQNENLGVIDYFVTIADTETMVIKGDKQKFIPFKKPHLISVDLANQKIIVDWDVDF